MVHPARVELTTSSFGGKRSIQLSYGCPKQRNCPFCHVMASRLVNPYDPPLAKPIALERVRATRSSIMIPWMTKSVFISRETGAAPDGSN